MSGREPRLFVWSVEATAGFDAAWATVAGGRLSAEGRAAALRPEAYWLSYTLETADEYRTARLRVESRWSGGSGSLELTCDDGHWTVDGRSRPDLDGALDCDLAACPLTNTMPILRHRLHERPGDHSFLMAFVEVPTLAVIPHRQRYTHLRPLPGGGAMVRYQSAGFESDLTIDADGFVVDYPKLGRRIEP